MEIKRRFNWSTTANDILQDCDLASKVAIVTGANCGIGFETARELALHGCKVIFACRSLENAEKAINAIRNEQNKVECYALKLDLQSLKSVRSFADQFKEAFKKLDILILNAGVYGLPYSRTEDGLETVFQVNHLSQFYLTLLLEESLVKGSPSRVVVVSSTAYRFSYLNKNKMDESNLSPENSFWTYWKWYIYCNSKLCNVLFSRAISERWRSKGISSYSVHPGTFVRSSISRNNWIGAALLLMALPFSKNLEQAASSTVYCACAPELEGQTGLYVEDCYPCEINETGRNDQLAEKIWNTSVNIINRVLPENGLKL